jgi:ribosomal protein L12E/L44/L45/RPP1/RPP2
MDETRLKPGALTTSGARADWTVDTIADQIFRILKGSVTRETILQIVNQVAPRYEDARIQIFVPILIQRDVIDELFTLQATPAPPGMGVKAVHPSERA